MLKIVWSSVKKILVKIGRVQTVIIMAVVYFLIIGPMAILFQIFHRQKQTKKSYWVGKEMIKDMGLYLTKQF